MTLLANDIVASPLRAKHPEIDRLARLLALPFAPNHAPRHAALGGAITHEAKQLAAVYTFDETSISTAWAINGDRASPIIKELGIKAD